MDTQWALDVETILKFGLEQRNDLISTKFQRCSKVMCQLGNYPKYLFCQNCCQNIKLCWKLKANITMTGQTILTCFKYG